jgi:hypothetical protein
VKNLIQKFSTTSWTKHVLCFLVVSCRNLIHFLFFLSFCFLIIQTFQISYMDWSIVHKTFQISHMDWI